MRISGEPRGIPRAIEAQLKSGSAGDLYGFHGLTIDGPAERKGGGEAHELLGDFVGVSKIEANENEPGQWNTYDIICKDDWIVVLVNGVLQNIGTKCSDKSGKICLQSEGTPIEYRNIYIEPLE